MRTLYPVIGSSDVAASRDFYVRLTGMDVVYDSGWYVQLVDPTRRACQLGIVEWDHESIPEPVRRRAVGVVVSLEVDDVDAVHARAVEFGLDIVQPLRDEPFGQRHFITVDPDGLGVDVITPIPFAPEFAASLTAAARRSDVG